MIFISYDQQLLDYTLVTQFLYKLQEKLSIAIKDFWTKNYFKQIETFIVQHRSCGCYLRLDLIGKVNYHKIAPIKEEKKILIRGRNQLLPSKISSKNSSNK